MMLKVGITGGIGSGKSYVSRMLTSIWGIPVYDCDCEAKRMNEESPVIRRKLEALVGCSLYDAEGHLQRERLASWLFSSPSHAESVNAIVHPVVMEDFLAWAERQDAPVVAIESAILYDCGFDTQVDKVIYVDASDEICLQRAMQRDRSSRRQILQRMKLQNAESYRTKADWILCNEGTEEDFLRAQLEGIVKLLKTQVQINNNNKC